MVNINKLLFMKLPYIVTVFMTGFIRLNIFIIIIIKNDMTKKLIIV